MAYWWVATRLPQDILLASYLLRGATTLHLLRGCRISCRPTELTLRISTERKIVTHWSFRGFHFNTTHSSAPKVPNLKVLCSEEQISLWFVSAMISKSMCWVYPVRTIFRARLPGKVWLHISLRSDCVNCLNLRLLYILVVACQITLVFLKKK